MDRDKRMRSFFSVAHSQHFWFPMLESQANYSRVCEGQWEGMVSYHTETLSAFWAKKRSR